MADGLPDQDLESAAEDRRRPVLDYPLPAPGVGEATAVADDVLWLRLPLPFGLDHINVWALRDEGGWTLVDTGVRTRATLDVWDAYWPGALEGLPVVRVICTHMHPDHVGLAGPITRRFGCRLWMSRLEYVTCRMLVADTGREAPEEGQAFYRAAGWDAAQIERYRSQFGGFGRGIDTLPDSYRRIEDGEILKIGGRAWTVVVGDGHSPEHACLWRRDDDLFIAGDQLLPRISSNVSVWPTEPDADPLGDWMASLARLRSLLPETVLVLPSHGEVFRGAHARLDSLDRRHRLSLDRLADRLKTPQRAIDVFGALFARPIGESDFGMATGESLAHLRRLVAQGRAERTEDADGVHRWRAT